MRQLKQLEQRLQAAELMYAQDEALLYKLNNDTPEGVDLQARAESLRTLNAAHQSDLKEIVQLRTALDNMPPATSVQRLGDVLYWLGCGLAALSAGTGVRACVVHHVHGEATPNSTIKHLEHRLQPLT